VHEPAFKCSKVLCQNRIHRQIGSEPVPGQVKIQGADTQAG